LVLATALAPSSSSKQQTHTHIYNIIMNTKKVLFVLLVAVVAFLVMANLSSAQEDAKSNNNNTTKKTRRGHHHHHHRRGGVKKLGCSGLCFKSALKFKKDEQISKFVPKCLQVCLKRSKVTKDDTAAFLERVDKIKKVLLEYNVQNKVADDLTVVEDTVSSDKKVEAFLSLSDSSSQINNGATLQATTAVNVRNGPCTSNGIVRLLQAGQTVTYTGTTKSGCGYTWYSVKGSFGSGYVASNYVKVSGGGGGGGGCRTRNYPLFKQCDGRWGSHSLGSSSVCRIGCLMSSVSMALNGLGKSVNGQSPNPGVLNAWLKSHGGYQGSLFIWGSVSPYGLRYLGQPSSPAEIQGHICRNNVVILNVNGGGHWVLATGYSNGVYTVNDPGYSRTSYNVGEVVRAGIFSV